MIIESVNVKNFRSIYDETLNLDNFTTLIGPNGVGKSSFLKAIDLFYNPNMKYTEEDFYNNDTTSDIEITICFSNLTDYEKDHFKKYVRNDRLIVMKVLKWPFKKSNQKYHGKHLQNHEFDSFRNALGASNLRSEYNKLKDKYPSLSDYTNKNNAELGLKEWEDKNPESCILRQDDGQFFGFNEIGITNLENFTRFIYIPAVHDASEEASEGGKSKSVFTQIMDLVIRGVLSQKEEFINLEQEAQKNYDLMMENEKNSLTNLEKEISKILGIFVPDASVGINWEHNTIRMPTPNANMKVVEDGYGASIERSGHGLQRAFIMTMFQYLTKIQSMSKIKKDESKTHFEPPNIIIGIEEPELYQHPNRQRYLSKILLRLTEGNIEGVAEIFQIIYTTHSPLFVDLENFENVRKLAKVEMKKDKPKVTCIYSTNFKEVVNLLENADGVEEGNYTSRSFKGSIKAVMTPWMNEGFFADMIVLVEGVDDRAAIIGLNNAINGLKNDFEGNGVAVIPCMGKNNLHKPYAIFTKLKIPVYCIWDSDHEKYKNSKLKVRNKEIKKNHKLLRLCGHNVIDWPDKVENNYACFKNNLNDTLKNEIGNEVYVDIINKCCRYYDMEMTEAVKRPKVIENLVKESKRIGCSSKTLEKIITKISELKGDNFQKQIILNGNEEETMEETKNVNNLDQWL